MYRAGNSVEQVFGGTVIKQGDRTPLGFNFRTENGELVYLTGSTVQVKLASNKGVVLEKQATISDDYTVQFAIGSQDITGAGDMRIEFIVTYSGGTIEKFPSDDWQRIRITPTLEDVEKYGVGYITFEQMKADMDKKYTSFQNQLNSIVKDAGNSNVEIVQARIDKGGNTFSTLKERLDDTQTKLQVIRKNKVYTQDFPIQTPEVDDTARVQRMFNSVASNVEFVFSESTYKFSKTGTFTPAWKGESRNYAILLRSKTNFSIKISPATKITFDVADANQHNCFVLDACEHVTSEGGFFEGIGNITTKQLYESSAFLINESKNVKVHNTIAKNTRHGIVAFRSQNVTMRDHLAYRTSGAYPIGAYFGLYSCEASVVDNGRSYGGTGDGDIGIFGGSSIDCTITNCRAFNYLYGDTTKTLVSTVAQGIYVDSGARDCKVIDSKVYGYYYGIDVKTDSEGTLVRGCTATRCKIGFAARLGEGNIPTNIVMFKDNKIVPNGGNGSTAVFDGVAATIGIYVQKTYGVSIDGNEFYNSYDTNAQNDFVDIYMTLYSDATEGYQSPTSIVNNNFRMENRLDVKVGYNKLSPIVVKGKSTQKMNNVLINNNTFDPFYGGTNACLIDASYINDLSIKNNLFGNQQGDYIIKAANCNAISISNTYNFHHGILQTTACKNVNFSGNVSFESIYGVGRPTLKFIDTTFITVNGNTYSWMAGGYADDVYFEMSGTSDWITVSGNTLELANKNSSNWYTLVGSNNAIGVNLIS